MKLISQSKLTEKKSKFFGFLYEISEEAEVNEIISELKKEHKKAAHVCYAAIIKNQNIELFKNDGEVGQPARALLDCLKEKNSKSQLLAVVRYFGGVKLGPGGVQRAFRAAGKECISE